jgi:predicted AlkP superfamily phosphohydrolase/phosphomutase
MIRVNLKGREPAGSVEPGPEYESLREQLIREFSQVTDPETGQPITERIFRREEIYEGPFLNEAPDLLIMTRDWAYPFYGDLAGRDLFRRPEDLSPSVHLSKGLFVLYGSGVREGGELEGASILDLPATILYLLGIPLPRRFDGRVLAGAFPDGVLEGAPPEYVDRGEEETTHHREALSDEERARVERSLKGLGYIG